MLTQAELKHKFHYNPKTGLFTRLFSSGQYKFGSVAGKLHHSGYWIISVNNKKYAAHRLAWLYVYGKWPVNQIDHINRIKTDNRIVNLRDVVAKENFANIENKKWASYVIYKNYLARIKKGG